MQGAKRGRNLVERSVFFAENKLFNFVTPCSACGRENVDFSFCAQVYNCLHTVKTAEKQKKTLLCADSPYAVFGESYVVKSYKTFGYIDVFFRE